MKNIVIIGASGHGGMVLDCINKGGRYKVIGFIDSFKKKGTNHCGLEVLGNENDLPELMKKLDITGAIFAIGNNWIRSIMALKVAEIAPELEMISAIHPSVIIGENVQIGKGSVIMPGAIVNSNANIGNHCIINTNASVGHDGNMGDFSSIASGVCTGGNFSLGTYSVISLGANVIENINIREHSVVGAGSLVVNDVEPYTVVYGSPARFIRERKEKDPYLSGDKKPSA